MLFCVFGLCPVIRALTASFAWGWFSWKAEAAEPTALGKSYVAETQCRSPAVCMQPLAITNSSSATTDFKFVALLCYQDTSVSDPAMSLPPPPQDPENTLGPGLRPAPSSSSSKRHLPSSGASAPTSRPVTSLLPVPSLPVIFTAEELARELELATTEGSDDSSDASSEDEAPLTRKKSGEVSSSAADNDPVKKSDPFHSAKSASGYEDAALATEKVLATFDKVYSHQDAAGSQRREALVKQVDQLRESAERARNVGR